MKDKTKQMIVYILKDYLSITAPTLTKLIYLIDLVSITRGNSQISDLKYKKCGSGLVDLKVYEYLDELVQKWILREQVGYSQQFDEYIVYCFEEYEDFIFDKLNDQETKIINNVLEELKGYGAKAISDIVYSTKPMTMTNKDIFIDLKVGYK